MYEPVTVAEMIQRPIFRQAQLVAGTCPAGMHRRVTWVHVLDLPDVRSLIRGGELILTTGIGLTGREEGLFGYVKQLIEQNASGLCIELGTAISTIPEPVLQLANSHDFPIVVFPDKVHFVDITQDVHRLILSRHHKFIDDLEVLSRKLHQLTVSAKGPKQMLGLVHEMTHASIIYVRHGASHFFVGSSLSTKVDIKSEWLRFLSETEALSEKEGKATLSEPQTLPIPEHFTQLRTLGEMAVIQSLVVLGTPQGTLGIITSADKGDEQLFLVLDRITSALSLDEFRRMSIEERQFINEQEWVDQITHASADVPAELAFNSKTPHTMYCVLLMPTPQVVPDSSEAAEDIPSYNQQRMNDKSSLSMMIRTALTREGLKPYLSVRQDTTIAVIEYNESKPHNQPSILREKIPSAIRQLKLALEHNGFTTQVSVGVGHEVSSAELPKSYQTALDAWQIGQKVFDNDVVFYEDLGIYQWIQHVTVDESTRHLLSRTLENVIAHDKQHHTHLFETLKVYLDCDRSVQKTAENLFIHRQTLYHRLRQLDPIVGVDLSEPTTRLGLHLSIYHYLFTIR